MSVEPGKNKKMFLSLAATSSQKVEVEIHLQETRLKESLKKF